ncbi:TPA: hypothetical protein KOY34_003631 [Clostridioides difficile]|uniref:Uncharacterized protein n=1 Tax=Clostridium phage phiCD146 TaxID=1582151 RepID=A0A0A8WIM1_9CAUD|nr:hypothetical protein [Clostridioides difficile]YP_009214168.1 hypothetical protein PHICD146_20040 [Clostridium phage phiCD146]CEK40369.1 conserved protein of unknown function [Clostridium phage phiCD146]HBF3543091.1 hypothetical protein [Clostridioides difficile]HBF7169711.1 hypothetical protein [Clostridioides difficile]HBF7965621.1 hypothetical protein [Clostridioides difficile]HBG5236702.1 hypothetical protein [Clostridioides difficile]
MFILYKDITKMGAIERGEYVGNVALELREENPHLSKIDLIELALKKIREESEQEAGQ